MSSPGYLVSILVPVYRVENYIERCARSLFEQDYENLEIVFVDDCSPDGSMQVLDRVVNEYPERKRQVRIVRHQKNRGLAAARNTAVANASGSFLLHCDSDDWLDRKAVSRMVGKQVQTGADIVSGAARAVYKRCSLIIREPRYRNKEAWLLDMLNVNKPLYHVVWRRLIRTSLYHKCHIVTREGINQGEDLQVMPKLMYYASRVVGIDEVVYNYNCMNSVSYCHQLDDKSSLWEQDLTSYDILQSFFSNKETVLSDSASEMTVQMYKEYSKRAARSGNKDLYRKYNAALNDRFSEWYHDAPFFKWVRRNYPLYRVNVVTSSYIYNLFDPILKAWQRISYWISPNQLLYDGIL